MFPLTSFIPTQNLLTGKGSDIDAAMKRIAALEAQVKTLKGDSSSGHKTLAFDPTSAVAQAAATVGPVALIFWQSLSFWMSTQG